MDTHFYGVDDIKYMVWTTWNIYAVEDMLWTTLIVYGVDNHDVPTPYTHSIKHVTHGI